jgi:hypothetical protein
MSENCELCNKINNTSNINNYSMLCDLHSEYRQCYCCEKYICINNEIYKYYYMDNFNDYCNIICFDCAFYDESINENNLDVKIKVNFIYYENNIKIQTYDECNITIPKINFYKKSMLKIEEIQNKYKNLPYEIIEKIIGYYYILNIYNKILFYITYKTDYLYEYAYSNYYVEMYDAFYNFNITNISETKKPINYNPTNFNYINITNDIISYSQYNTEEIFCLYYGLTKEEIKQKLYSLLLLDKLSTFRNLKKTTYSETLTSIFELGESDALYHSDLQYLNS